MSFNA
jgi:hypothetical protein